MSDDPNLGPIVTPDRPRGAPLRVLLAIAGSIALLVLVVLAVAAIFLIGT